MRKLVTVFSLIMASATPAMSQSGPEEFIYRYFGEVQRSQSFSFKPVFPAENCSSEIRGTVFFDNDSSQFCFCNGTLWCIIGGECGTSSSCIAPTPTPVP